MRTAPRSLHLLTVAVLLLYAGVAPLVVWNVFRSPAIDYRLVAAGAVLPLADAVTGGPWILHTMVCSVAILAVAMLTTRRRRLLRRRWLGLPIGMLIHLAIDSLSTRAEVFWWPFLGVERGGIGEGRVPELDRGVATLVIELVGAACLVWCWRAFGLGDPDRRRRFLRTGQLDRAFVDGSA